MKPVYQAAPLLCMPKKNGKLRTVVDAWKRNDNTYKDVTPFPDQDQICMDVALSKYRTKIVYCLFHVTMPNQVLQFISSGNFKLS